MIVVFDMGRRAGVVKICFYILLSSSMLLVALPLTAATTGEKVIVNPAGSASWSDHVWFQSVYPQFGKKPPEEIPFMPMPRKSIDLKGVPQSALPHDLSAPSRLDSTQSRGPSAPLLDSGEETVPLIPVINGFQALPDNNEAIPPDSMGAAGPNHLMTMLNTQVRIQTKSGTDLGTTSLAAWWTSGTGLAGVPFDPRIIYDTLSNRWIAVVTANPRNLTASRTWLAISDSSDPTGTWKYYSFNMETPGNNNYWQEFPDIGTNKDWIAVSSNMYDSGDFFSGTAMWVVDKTTIGGALTSYRFPEGFDVVTVSTLNTYGFTLRPAVTFDATEPVLYIVDGNAWSSAIPTRTGIIRLSRITGTPPGAPVWSTVPDAGGILPGSGWYFSPQAYDPWYQIDASQLGTTTRVNTNDPRILNAVFRDGRLWFTHSGGRPYSDSTTKDRTVVSWYEVDPALLNTTDLPTVQSGTLDPGPDGHYFFPSIAVNGSNDVALGFSHSNPSIYVQAAATGRKSTDPVGAMDAITVIKTGEDSYVKDFGSGRVRWGDYSATIVDPADDSTFWTIQEYAEIDVGAGASDDRWGTWWAHLDTVPPCGLLPGTKDAMLRDTVSKWIGKCVHGPDFIPTAASVYTDVAISDYNADWITQLHSDGITKGCNIDNTLYCPKDPVTKVQAPKLILRAEHGGSYMPPAASAPPYIDVPLTHPDVDWIARAKAEGITTGCSATMYCPDEVLTEQGFLKMLDGAF